MPHGSTKPGGPPGMLIVSILALVLRLAGGATPSSASPPGASCPGDNGGITLPKGFCATIFADGIGHARQLAVAPGGTVYVNTWSGVYYKNDTPPAGGFLVALKDTTGAGHANVVRRFGETFADGGHGGTGIALYKGSLYAEINDRIVRYPLRDGAIVPGERPETSSRVFLSPVTIPCIRS
jgi:glucose/arabinose dehydrogenase